MVAVIGRKHSGKTTLTVRLAAALHERGHRVMTIKHGSHTFNIDPATTDTYRHFHEGKAERVAMAAPDKFALIARWDAELSPEAIAERHMSDADIVLCEGFKMSALPKIEVFRVAAHPTPLFTDRDSHRGTVIAVVTDVADLKASMPVLRFADDQWLAALTTQVEREIMGTSR
jgi:molybdopterin-guanine dinucleotide biosynthesis protein B